MVELLIACWDGKPYAWTHRNEHQGAQMRLVTLFAIVALTSLTACKKTETTETPAPTAEAAPTAAAPVAEAAPVEAAPAEAAPAEAAPAEGAAVAAAVAGEAKVHNVACACSQGNACANMIEVEGKYVELTGELGLDKMAFCGKKGLKGEAKGELKDGKFVASSFKLVE